VEPPRTTAPGIIDLRRGQVPDAVEASGHVEPTWHRHGFSRTKREGEMVFMLIYRKRETEGERERYVWMCVCGCIYMCVCYICI
jgi:hypothetical protein